MRYSSSILSFIFFAVQLLFFPTWVNAQKSRPQIYSVFKVTEAWRGSKNVSKQLKEEGAYTMFYKFDKRDSLHYMANVWPKSGTQSFGPMIDVTRENIPASADNYETDYLHFEWHYINSCDLKQGIAVVEVIIEQMLNDTWFTVKILPEDQELTVYKGKMEK